MRKSLIAVIVGAGLIGAPAALNHAGFCWKEKRWLSDEELISVAINAVNHTQSFSTVSAEDPDKVIQRKQIPYVSVKDFLANNPNCCKFHTGSDVNGQQDYYNPSNLLDRLFGTYRGTVSVNFIPHYEPYQDDAEKKEVLMYYPLSNCGAVW